MKRLFNSRLFQLSGALLLGAGLLCSPLKAAAAEGDTNLVVELKSGTVERFKLAEQPVLTFDGDDCTISTSSYVVTYAMADIEKAHFDSAMMQGVQNVENEIGIDLSRSGLLTVNGAAPGTPVSIYDMEGRLVAAATAGADGTATIDIDRLPSAVYIVSISNLKNFKLYKR